MSTLNCRMQIASRVTAVSKYLEPNLCLEASTTEGAEEGLRLSTPPPGGSGEPGLLEGQEQARGGDRERRRERAGALGARPAKGFASGADPTNVGRRPPG